VKIGEEEDEETEAIKLYLGSIEHTKSVKPERNSLI
jgi:hypothetical protein